MTILRDAAIWARGEGVPVRIGSLGVHCTSSHGRERWQRDPRASGVDPLGAILLQHQPEPTEHHRALAALMEVHEAYVHGAEDALAGEPMSKSWGASISARMYVLGYQCGWLFREELLRGRTRAA
jgi:hypothetical protein